MESVVETWMQQDDKQRPSREGDGACI
eukprot:COSAG02_NODE_3602_length_6498_cov_2.647914_6_plen_26_part_01